MEWAILRLEPPRAQAEHLEAAASLAAPDGRSCRLWWRLPAEWAHALTPWADPFVVGLLFPAMQWGRPVRIEGPVSPSLLRNLDQFMAVWHQWFPDRYARVDLRAAEETELPLPAAAGETLCPFSRGLDSSFTIFRHARRLAGRAQQNLAAAAVFNGFDIWLDRPGADALYADLLAGARAMLDSVGLPAIPMASNFHDLPTVWADSLGTHLVSGLMLLAGRFGRTLLPNTVPYYQIYMPWGSHPICDPLLGSDRFPVVDDGADFERLEKVQLVADWPEAMRHLRVCFHTTSAADNCCRCEKCIRTILSFRALGLPRPAAFPLDVSDRQIRRTRFPHQGNTRFWEEAAHAAQARGLGRASWVRALHAAVRRDTRRRFLARLKRPFLPLRALLRRLFRGSPLSRRQKEKLAHRS